MKNVNLCFPQAFMYGINQPEDGTAAAILVPSTGVAVMMGTSFSFLSARIIPAC